MDGFWPRAFSTKVEDSFFAPIACALDRQRLNAALLGGGFFLTSNDLTLALQRQILNKSKVLFSVIPR